MTTIEILALDEKDYWKMQVNGPIRQNYNGNEEQWKAEKRRCQGTGEEGLQFGSWGPQAGGGPVGLEPGPPPPVTVPCAVPPAWESTDQSYVHMDDSFYRMVP